MKDISKIVTLVLPIFVLSLIWYINFLERIIYVRAVLTRHLLKEPNMIYVKKKKTYESASKEQR